MNRESLKVMNWPSKVGAPDPSLFEHVRQLRRQADLELFQGNPSIAERLERLALEIEEVRACA